MKRIRSKLLDETMSVADDGSVTFESGVTYTRDEVAQLRNGKPEDVKAVHMVKALFGGDVRFVKDPEAEREYERSLIVKFWT